MNRAKCTARSSNGRNLGRLVSSPISCRVAFSGPTASGRTAARTVTAIWCGMPARSGGELEREVQDAVVIPKDDPKVGAFVDEPYLVTDPVGDDRRLRVVENDAFFLVKPTGFLVHLGADAVEMER